MGFVLNLKCFYGTEALVLNRKKNVDDIQKEERQNQQAYKKIWFKRNRQTNIYT